MIESIVAQVNMVVASAAQVLTSLTSVARVILGASVGYLHNDTGAIASAVPATVVLTSDLESTATHGGWAGWALALAQVRVPTVVTIAFGTGGIGWVVLPAAAYIPHPELGSVGRCATVAALCTTNCCATLGWSVVGCGC